MRQLNDWQQLQTLVGASEAYDLDFKEAYDKDDIEYARDVCALANTFGGHIVVGASTEAKFTCTGFHGIERKKGKKIADDVEKAVKARCRPTPLFAVRSVDIPGKESVVVVIEVHASQLAPVGVSTRHKEAEKLVNDAWSFPIRVGSQTEYLSPDQFGVLESMTARRAAALLNGIPAEERHLLTLRFNVRRGQEQAIPHEESVELVEIDLLRNTVNLVLLLDDKTPLAVALDQVDSVWRAPTPESPRWQVSMRGELDPYAFREPRMHSL